MPIDYSKWNDIDLSDDEEEVKKVNFNVELKKDLGFFPFVALEESACALRASLVQTDYDNGLVLIQAIAIGIGKVNFLVDFLCLFRFFNVV